MPRQDFDKSSKWLLQHHGRSILFLVGMGDVRQCRALQAEIVQPRRLPDGLLEVQRKGSKRPDQVVVEIATYAEKRVLGQALGDVALVYQEFGVPPDLLVLVLRPKGKFRITESHHVGSRLGWSSLAGTWKVVELWTFSAAALLAADDVGLIPWVPLTSFARPPEDVLRDCRERIERQSAAAEKTNLLAVTQVLTRLRFPNPNLLALLGGQQVMIESPLIEELVAERLHKAILAVLERRFGPVPIELVNLLHSVRKEKKLIDLNVEASACASLDNFRDALLAV